MPKPNFHLHKYKYKRVMLIQRILTALVLVPLVVWGTLKLSADYFALVYGLVILVAAWEWTNLMGYRSALQRSLFLASLIFAMLFIHYWTMVLEVAAQTTNWPEIRFYSGLVEFLMIPPVIWWVFIMVILRNHPDELLKLQLKTKHKFWIGWFILLAGWMFLSRLHTIEAPEMTLYFFILIWAADISAYFVGRKYGSTKLSPDISPGKTVAGFYGALASALVCAIGFGLYYQAVLMSFADVVMLSVMTVLISIYGDLFFSLAKRIAGIKDSGSILPGHGGILDRLDSVIAAAPVFYAGVWVIRWMADSALVA